uniref:Proline rich 33 n=1 Tax=Ornithorhynchus anatinus TaxID=9258 RepID=A0A6I8MXR7_ORNAN
MLITGVLATRGPPAPPPPLLPKPGHDNVRLQRLLRRAAKKRAGYPAPMPALPFRASLSPVSEASQDLDGGGERRLPAPPPPVLPARPPPLPHLPAADPSSQVIQHVSSPLQKMTFTFSLSERLSLSGHFRAPPLGPATAPRTLWPARPPASAPLGVTHTSQVHIAVNAPPPDRGSPGNGGQHVPPGRAQEPTDRGALGTPPGHTLDPRSSPSAEPPQPVAPGLAAVGPDPNVPVARIRPLPARPATGQDGTTISTGHGHGPGHAPGDGPVPASHTAGDGHSSRANGSPAPSGQGPGCASTHTPGTGHVPTSHIPGDGHSSHDNGSPTPCSHAPDPGLSTATTTGPRMISRIVVPVAMPASRLRSPSPRAWVSLARVSPVPATPLEAFHAPSGPSVAAAAGPPSISRPSVGTVPTAGLGPQPPAAAAAPSAPTLPGARLGGWTRLRKQLAARPEAPLGPDSGVGTGAGGEEPRPGGSSQASRLWDAVLYKMAVAKPPGPEGPKPGGGFLSRCRLPLLFRPRFDARKLRQAATGGGPAQQGAPLRAREPPSFNRTAAGWRLP